MDAHTHVSVAILAQAEHLLQILCTPMASGWEKCKLCESATFLVWDDWKQSDLPLYWKRVWCPTPAGGEYMCICKACRQRIWRDCRKLEPVEQFSVQDFYDAVEEELLKATSQPTTESQNSSDDVDVFMG